MNEDERHSLFSSLVARHQNELYSYLLAVVRNWSDADDLLQSICLVLWRKFDSFEPGSNFLFWASRTAKIEVHNFLRRKQMSHLASDELLDALAGTIVRVQNEDADLYSAALRHCRQKLSPVDDQLIELHYAEELGSRQIADQLCRTQSSICNSLKRIRRWLFDCIQHELARREHPRKEPS